MTGWGLIRVKEQEESASELVPLVEAGKTTGPLTEAGGWGVGGQAWWCGCGWGKMGMRL